MAGGTLELRVRTGTITRSVSDGERVFLALEKFEGYIHRDHDDKNYKRWLSKFIRNTIGNSTRGWNNCYENIMVLDVWQKRIITNATETQFYNSWLDYRVASTILAKHGYKLFKIEKGHRPLPICSIGTRYFITLDGIAAYLSRSDTKEIKPYKKCVRRIITTPEGQEYVIPLPKKKIDDFFDSLKAKL